MLEKFAAQKPDDPFPCYGLALEYRKLGKGLDARRCFDQLMTKHPGYVPAYLMAGNLLVELGERGAAAEVFERGMAAARASGDLHALAELESARAALE